MFFLYIQRRVTTHSHSLVPFKEKIQTKMSTFNGLEITAVSPTHSPLTQNPHLTQTGLNDRRASQRRRHPPNGHSNNTHAIPNVQQRLQASKRHTQPHPLQRAVPRFRTNLRRRDTFINGFLHSIRSLKDSVRQCTVRWVYARRPAAADSRCQQCYR